jgi:integrase
MAKKKSGRADGKGYYTRIACGRKFYSTISQAEADAKAEEYRKLKERDVFNPDITVAEYVLRWYERHKQKVGAHCAEEYYYRSKTIISLLGRYKLKDITPLILEDAVEEFSCTKLEQTKDYPSQKYINQIISVLKLIFKQARKERYFDYNYAEDVSVKSKKSNKNSGARRALTTEELHRILNFEHKYAPMVWFMLFCGLMPEEVVPLTWADILYDESSDSYKVDVNKTALLLNSGGVDIRPETAKTEFRLRTIAIPYPLSDWIHDNIGLHKGKELIFPNNKGLHLSKTAIRGRFETYLKDLDCWVHLKNKHNPNQKYEMSIDKFCMYDLRHTFITLLANIDTPVRKTTALAGHSGSETADKYYIDYDKLSTDQDIKRLGSFLKKTQKRNSESDSRATKNSHFGEKTAV